MGHGGVEAVWDLGLCGWLGLGRCKPGQGEGGLELGHRACVVLARLSAVALALQGCYEKVKMWFDDHKHVLGTVGMCILIIQVRAGGTCTWTWAGREAPDPS